MRKQENKYRRAGTNQQEVMLEQPQALSSMHQGPLWKEKTSPPPQQLSIGTLCLESASTLVCFETTEKSVPA